MGSSENMVGSLGPVAKTTTVVRSRDVVETTVGTEVVLMTLQSGDCIGLGDTGSAVWNLLAEPIQVQEVVAQLSRTYEAPPEVIEHDVVELLDDLHRRGLVDIR